MKTRVPIGVSPLINSKVAVPLPTRLNVDSVGPVKQLTGQVIKVPENSNGLVNVRFVRLNGIVICGPVNVNVPAWF